jgi:hypothetical protein
MGSKNGKPVLRDQDVQALAKSSGLGEDQVSTSTSIEVRRLSNPVASVRTRSAANPVKRSGAYQVQWLRGGPCQ